MSVIGEKIEDVEVLLHDGTKTTLSDLFNEKEYLIIYFYPKDNTPGCTKEACSFRDEYEVLKAKSASVVGVSKDSVNSHVKFIDKYGLPFPLISDPKLALTKMIGGYGKKARGGTGLIRSTFILDKDLKIKYIFGVGDNPKVATKTHGKDVLDVLDKL